MNRKRSILLISLILVCGLGALFLIPNLTRAQSGDPATSVGSKIAAPQGGGAPSVVSYQGQVTVGGAPFNGTGHFKFAIVNQAGESTTGPASFMVVDPDGNPILVDQHV